MKKGTVAALIIGTVILGAVLPGIPAKKNSYTGVKKCVTCHGQDALGNQYGLWLNSPHAKAAVRLLDANSAAIAARHKIDRPEQSPACLKCHTTGGGNVKELMTEGVGCESCHGPAERYSEVDIHVDFTNRERAYQRAVQHGMYPILGIKHIKNREKLCLHCHRDTRPCYPDNRKDIDRQGISLQVISEMKKGDVKLNHGLRR